MDKNKCTSKYHNIAQTAREKPPKKQPYLQQAGQRYHLVGRHHVHSCLADHLRLHAGHLEPVHVVPKAHHLLLQTHVCESSQPHAALVWVHCKQGQNGPHGGCVCVCVCVCDFLSRTERERVNDFVEIVTFPGIYMSIVRYGVFCIGYHCN